MDTPSVRQSLGADSIAGPAAGERVLPWSYYRTRLLLIGAASASAICFLLASRWFGIPRVAGYDVSLLLQSAPALALLTTAVIFFAATVLGTLIAGTVRLDAGLFAAAVGLTVLTLRGGPSRYVIARFDSPAGYVTLAGEAAFLFAIVGIAWYGLRVAHFRGLVQGDVSRDGIADLRNSTRDILLAAVLQGLILGLIVAIIAQTDAKKQVFGALIVGSIVASIVAYRIVPVQRSIAYWLGPFITAVFGYLMAYAAAAPPGWWLGPRGMLAGLARPLPLDYASVGVAGSILGYWVGRRGQADEAAPTPSV